MPRNVDPAEIKKGSGMANQDSVDANAFVDEVVEGQNHALDAHANDPQGAHPASAISTTTSQGQYDSDDVQGNLDELSGLVPLRPPTIGNYSNILAYTGIPDWGHLKLHDAGFVQRGEVTSPDPNAPNSDFFVYPEFWFAPRVATDIYDSTVSITPLPNERGGVFTLPGNDPQTDPTFNLDPSLTPDPTYTGGGQGKAHQGGFSSSFFAITETMRVMPSTGSAFTPIVVSGAVYPADRGVMALIYWPALGDVAAFLAEPLTTRCPAALLLGQGFDSTCDGDTGGIFSEGAPDLYAFPGRATGQYDLDEIHAGTNRITGNPLPAGPLPGAGQVRLGTDPAAGPVVAGGIPILGGTSIATGGGNDNNFFRYRLPYLNNYSDTDGVEYTPSTERPRFFDKPPVSDDNTTDLTQGGDYEDFPKDYWHFQVARYRHRFLFTQNTPMPPDPQIQGNFFLMHFKREADFEVFVRDGVMPDDLFAGYDLWGAGLVNYIPPDSTDNLTDATTFAPEIATSLAYHTGRYSIIEDQHTAITDLSLAYTYTAEFDQVMWVSGVRYFLGNGSAIASNFTIDTMTVSLGGLFQNTYRLGNNGTGLPFYTPGLEHLNPFILYLGGHTAQVGTFNNGAGVGYTGLPFYQRVDFIYSDLGSFDLTSPPSAISTADVILTGGDTPITFNGDGSGGSTPNQAHFWEDSRIRAFARVPSDQEDASTYSTEHLLPQPGGKAVLYHTTDHSPNVVGTSPYGNFTLGGLGNPPRAGLETARKDVEERFLDEVYRVSAFGFPTLDPTYSGSLMRGNLTGPGLPFPAVPIELPVRIASTSPFAFGFGSFLQNNYHQLSLALPPISSTEDEAQIVGLPDRNPPVTDGVANPCPFSGRLVYPVTDYGNNFRPSLVDADISSTQPNYSTIADDERFYIRVFDAAYSNDGTPEFAVIGQPFLTFRIDGLELSDFAFVPSPGPGNTEIAIEVKIPGYTTWMDLGRVDGAGPSKQDTLADGAGCQINDSTVTFNGRDAVTGTVYSQVKVNVGPSANVFANIGTDPFAPLGVAPVLVRVRMKQGSSLDFTQGGPNSSADTPRAMCGITLLRHSDGTGPNDAAPYGPPAFP